MSEKPTRETVDSLRQQLRVAERVKQAAIDCTKSWDTILDELVWERPDIDAHEIPADHLQTMIARYPHHAEALAEFAARWNADKPLSDEELNSMEVDEESVKQSTARCLLMLKWAMRIRNAETERDALREAFKAACAFIDSNVADPDITNEMVRTYAEFQRHRALLGKVAG